MPSRNASSCVSAVESQPLLSASECSRSVSGPASGSTGQALSSGSSFNAQLASLIWIRVVDPITFTQAFPYANELVAGIHVTDDPSWIGFYSGLLDSAFAIAQLFSIYHYAKISDRVGRRPVLLVGLAGVIISTLLFGLSRRWSLLVATRLMSGLFTGNTAVAQSALAELTNPSNDASAIVLSGLARSAGGIVGPLIGGSLSNPARQFPKLFAYGFFKQYPYFLPGLVTASIGAVGFIAGYFVLEETLPSKRKCADVGSGEPDESGGKCLTVRQMLGIPIIRSLCMTAFTLNLEGSSFNVIFVLFCYTPVQSGGLGLPASRIGYALAMSGFMGMACQLVILRTILRRFEHAKIYHFCMSVWPFTFALLPLLNLIARSGYDSITGTISPDRTVVLWVGIAFVLALARIACFCYGVSLVLVKTHAPEGSLGMTNGMVLWTMCLARAIGPALVSYLFSFSIDNNILAGHFWIVIMSSISIGGSLSARNIVKATQAPKR